MLPGPPYAITRTAICSTVMHQIHDGAHRVDLRLRQDAVAEIEDVAGTSTGALQDVPHLAVAFGGRRQQRHGLEVALNGPLTDAGPRGIERNAPVDADHIATGRHEILE